jgi:multicomponent Na+:H+ antiporter subunit E
MKNRIVFFFVSLAVWLILTWSLSWQNLLAGALACAFVAFVTGDLFTSNSYKFIEPARYLWLLLFIPVFIWEVVKANFDVAYRVIHPSLPIKPGIIKVKTELKGDTGLTFLANAISLMPGTTSVDIDRPNGYIYVHWINVKSENSDEATGIIIGNLEKILERIFE